MKTEGMNREYIIISIVSFLLSLWSVEQFKKGMARRVIFPLAFFCCIPALNIILALVLFSTHISYIFEEEKHASNPNNSREPD
jgi:uncharacterized membrane protein